MKKLFITSLIILINLGSVAQKYTVKSPDGRILVSIELNNHLSFEIKFNDESLVQKSYIDMVVSTGPIFSDSPKADSLSNKSHSGKISPVVSSKDAVILDHYNELIIYTNLQYSITFRVYNDGVAYRFTGAFTDSVNVLNERLELNLPSDSKALFPKENSLVSHYERMYIPTDPDTLSNKEFCSLPMYIKSANKSIVFTEADLYDYPNMFLAGKNKSGFSSLFPNKVIESKPKNGSDRNQDLVYSNSSIAYTEGTRTFPWRVFIIGENDAELVESNLVFQLSRPLEIDDPSWINPGKVAWDWYNANNLYGVDFESGINTKTYSYYIDFASRYGLQYIILDEGWSLSTTDISAPNSNIDLHYLIEYGKKKNVGIILWVLWEPLKKDVAILEEYHNWGIKGIKVDFMQRADQDMVNYYEKVAMMAAKSELLVDFHGSYKPSGLRRAYPNVLTYEGLKGNENNKWSSLITPKHNVTLPFIRMVAGPMDYTPGAMRNTNLNNHYISWTRPASIGTRCHEVAMYVVYESPLQMLCDSPSNYESDHEITEFISQIPVTWDETIVINGKVGEYIVIARRKDNTWYLAAMTDKKRTIEIDLNFLPDGKYNATIARDGENAGKFAEDYIIEEIEINSNKLLAITLAEGGGTVVRIR